MVRPVAREDELRALATFARSTTWPRSLLLTGRAGIGTSMLARALADDLAATGCTVVRLTPSEPMSDVPGSGLVGLRDPVVLAIDDEDRVHVLWQYRHPVGRRFVEIPAGLLDGEPGELGAPGEANGEADPMYDQAVGIVLQHKRASISLVQRHLRIGYNRAARLLEQMEKSGLVSSMATNGNRDLLVPRRDE